MRAKAALDVTPAHARAAQAAALALVFALVCVAAAARPAAAQEPTRRVYETRRIEGAPPAIDGQVDDPAWSQVAWSGDFLEHDPHRGEAPAQRTEFKILYDDEALYVAYRAHDTEPDRISSQTTRRDWFPGDWVEINIDSRFDRRTAYSFTASVSGVRGDEYISQDGDNWDPDWDPIWFLETAIDEDGWTAEARIPLSQLRFSDLPEHVWGIQVTRRVFREEERSCWQAIPQDASGWVSRFGELRGITGIRPGRQLELLPYALTSAERFAEEDGNPFATGSDERLAFGLDGKMGLGGLTLDLTVNPDFGQIEADPSEVNLSAFETFFSEKRPFFIEGNDIFEFPLAPAITGGSFTSDRLFYSRRIGRGPRHFPDEAGASVDFPENTSILGAAKLSGKTQGGTSIGILESVTAREEAELDVDGARRQETVEPLTNFFVGRARQDLHQGRTVVGLLATAVHRKIDDDPLRFLHTAAYSGGLDLLHQTEDRRFYAEGNVSLSRVEGDAAAIRADQLASARYYQRPDADHVEFDSTRTSLSGHAGSLRLGKSGGGITRFQTGVAWRSPGFESNDLGFLRSADEINQFTWFSLQFNEPFSIFNRLQINSNQWTNYDFGGNNTSNAVNVNYNADLRNRWEFGSGLTREFEHISNTALRGGPSSRWPGAWETSWWVNSDQRHSVSVSLGGGYTFGDEDYTTSSNHWIDVTVRPSARLRFTVSPAYTVQENELQYFTTTGAGTPEASYLFASLDQETADLTFRLDYAAAPDLTIQLYAQPFIAAGEYDAFKRITNPRAERYEERWELAPEEDRPGRGDFGFRDFNSNVVLRWEFQPGSLLYVVWNQNRQGADDGLDARHPLSIGDDADRLFDVHPHDIFLIKVSRWFSV